MHRHISTRRSILAGTVETRLLVEATHRGGMPRPAPNILSIKPFRSGSSSFSDRNLTPTPCVPSNIKTTPASSSARLRAAKLAGTNVRDPFSKCTIVRMLTPLASASCNCVISIRARAARHWAGEISISRLYKLCRKSARMPKSVCAQSAPVRKLCTCAVRGVSQ